MKDYLQVQIDAKIKEQFRQVAEEQNPKENGGNGRQKAHQMWNTLTPEEQEMAREHLKCYAGSDGPIGRMWEMYEEGARGVNLTVEEYQTEISYGEYVKRITEDWS